MTLICPDGWIVRFTTCVGTEPNIAATDAWQELILDVVSRPRSE